MSESPGIIGAPGATSLSESGSRGAVVRWIITQYQHSWVDTHLLVLVWTDQLIHAFLHYSLSPEIFDYVTSERRGIRRLVKPLWELAEQITIEQAQNGDTLAHAFYIPAIPDQATLTFYLSATHEGIEAKSMSIPVKIQHPNQNSADPIDCPDLKDTLRFIPWESNLKDAVGIHDDIWNVTGMTGSAYFAYGMNQLSLIIGPTPGSIAQIYAGSIFDLALNHTLDSQLRAVIRFPIITGNTHACIAYGSYFSGSGYGFVLSASQIYAFRRGTGGGAMTLLIPAPADDTTYLLEAKYKAGSHIEWWVDGSYILQATSQLPDSADNSFYAYITDSATPSVAIHFRRFMIWKQSIWTGAYHESS